MREMKLLDTPRKEKREMPLMHFYGVPDKNNEILIGLRIAEWLLDDRLKLAKILQVVKKMLKRVEDENEKAD
jgi:hypothetical protein